MVHGSGRNDFPAHQVGLRSMDYLLGDLKQHEVESVEILNN